MPEKQRPHGIYDFLVSPDAANVYTRAYNKAFLIFSDPSQPEAVRLRAAEMAALYATPRA